MPRMKRWDFFVVAVTHLKISSSRYGFENTSGILRTDLVFREGFFKIIKCTRCYTKGTEAVLYFNGRSGSC